MRRPETIQSGASGPKGKRRQTVSVRKKMRGWTSSAPAASTNGVKGNGGGIRSRTASATAPFSRTRARIRVSRLGAPQPPLADLDAHPERQRRAGERAGRCEQRDGPPKVAEPRGEDDD